MNLRSKNEKDALQILHGMFPNTAIQHDHHLGHGLKLDFLIRSGVPIGVEIDGGQHYAYNTRYHRSKEDFEKQVERDKRKEQICKERGICFVRYDASKGVKKSALEVAVHEAIDSFTPLKKEKEKKPVSEFMNEVRNRQKAWRKEAYKTMKANKKKVNK